MYTSPVTRSPVICTLRMELLDGICPEAVHLLKEKRVTGPALREFRKARPMRQIEMAELMCAANNFSVGYADGADQSAQDAGIPVVPGKILTKAVLAGDANMDGTVDFFDLTQVLGYKYNAGTRASYTDGDLNYDGVVDGNDIGLIISAGTYA